jgi:hypothetical protein
MLLVTKGEAKNVHAPFIFINILDIPIAHHSLTTLAPSCAKHE